ncbi:MAG: hypothetical protein J7K40_12085 [candidate division Zixibacteria bacterium]|nr:hypothetical protein [candidate division Zixibacteria bacterium]
MRKILKPGIKVGLIIFCAILIFGLSGPNLMAMNKQVAQNPMYYSGMGKVFQGSDTLVCNVGMVENFIGNSTYTKATGTQEWSILIGDDSQAYSSMVWKTPAVYQNNSYLYFGSLRLGYQDHIIHLAEDRATNIVVKKYGVDEDAISLFDTDFYIDDQSSIVPAAYKVGVGIRQKTYAWSESYRDDFIIYDYWIYNLSGDVIDSLYVGFHNDADVSLAEGGSGDQQWSIDDLPGYYRDDVAKEYISYVFDGDNPNIPGDDLGGHRSPKESAGYIGSRLLFTPPRSGAASSDTTIQTGHGWWNWNNDPSEANGFKDWYEKLIKTEFMAPPPSPFDYRYFQKCGPFSIPADDSIRVVYAFGVGEGLEGLRENLEWADYLYEHNWIGPAAPIPPAFTLVPGDGFVQLDWDVESEASIDPYSGEQDFEGYRVWRETSTGWSLLMECDLVNEMGFNTGLVHSYTDYDVINFFQYAYAVTAYDRGDPINNIESLESGKEGTKLTVEPGIYNNTANAEATGIHVVPNPFVAQSAPNFGFTPTTNNPSTERILFVNLPPNSTVKIYTLTGDMVTTVQNIENTDNADLGWQTTASWDLITDHMQTIVSGLYLYVVEAPGTDDFIGKFAVVR